MIGTDQATTIAAEFWLPVVAVIAANTLLFIFCSIVKDNSWIDAFWGITFIVPIAVVWIQRSTDPALLDVTPQIDARMILSFTCICIWGIRLALHIGCRHTQEDFRYQDFRNKWGVHGTFWLYVQFYCFIFLLQAVFSLIVNSAALYIAIFSGSKGLIWTDYLGAAIWLIGFLIEAIGDYQLQMHLKDRTPGKKKFIMWGLWRYTRHPNYFGEAVLWWGMWIMACSIQWGWVTVFAPIWITYLVRFWSGVPMLEKKYENNPEFKAYCEETNVFCPWFVNRKEGSYEL